MKDMGRCGNVAFCAMVLFYCSLITGDYRCVSSAAHVSSSPHASVKRRDGVRDVNMTSSLQPETPPVSNQTQSSTNHTTSTEPTPHTDTTTEKVANSSAPAENVSFSGNITDSRNESDVSPMNNQTTVTMVRPTTPATVLPSTIHESTSIIHITTFHPTPTETTRAPEATRPESTSAHPKQTSSPTTSSFTAAAFPAVSTQMSTSSSPVQAKAHVDTPSALNVGDDDNKVSTDPLLAGLVSAFVVVAAIVSVLIFLKFRNTNDGPEFRRLQDLPMDDMLEDAPLSMYSY
ncbi:uncharacterized protein LOC127502117 [Ctenopharyngodon idella]|uniref:uncharacterized protein LOC127502117 n=1 Tax=Ctenopharyngodon idella TaxID=7959 RepID=UPI002230D741|nr:uncharacterized protein LOC127502117 [Ctenopharyngodon idella]